MRYGTWALSVIIVFLFVSAVSAEVGDVVTLASSKEWVIANTADTSAITARVTNASSGNGLSGIPVTFIVDDPRCGSFFSSSGITDLSGSATTVFRGSSLSGVCSIRATIKDGEAVYNQKIDHDSPYAVTFDYAGEVLVNETTTITANLKDRWGNPVDNRRVVEQIRFAIGSPSGGAGFWSGGGYSDEIILPVNEAGTASTVCKVDTIAGDNIIWMEHLGTIPDKYFTILGFSEGVPQRMTAEVSPPGIPNPAVPADGKSFFSLKYTLYDVFGNRAGNRTVWVNTSIGETYLLRSGSMGEILATYGPKDSISAVGIDAVAVDNPALTSSLTVEFVTTDPTNIILTANPQTMPSHDIAPAFTSNIQAKVMDMKGNPVAGEVVTFALGAVTYDGTYNITSAPVLLSTTATTDGNGFATVPFQPGGFITDEFALNYNPTATGHAVVTATWNGLSRDMAVTWNNYPYLSVETNVNPSTVAVNDTVDVSIRLRADGWAFRPDPIDVMLIFDQSGSMEGQKLADAKVAAKTFVDQMNATRDKVGLYAYSDTFTLKNSLTNNFLSVKTNIDSLAASGWTGTRRALKESIDNVIANRNPDPRSVQAVVLMTDGEYNYYGCPLARGVGYDPTYAWITTETDRHTWFPGFGGGTGVSGTNLFTHQNLSIYARDSSIRVYTISFGSGITPGSVTWNTLETLSESTGAKHYHAATGSDLVEMYSRIAAELITSAGVDTTMTNKFENVPVNDVLQPGADVFRYEYVDGISTRITWPNGTVTMLDHTNDWNNAHTLNFNIGEIKLGETWEARFRFRVLKEGNIDVFGTASTLSFIGVAGPSTLTLPHTYITAIPNLTNTGMNQAVLDVSNLHCTKEGVITDIIPVAWNIAYTGKQTVTEKISYSNDGGHTWILFDTNYVTAETMTDSAKLDVRTLPAGEYRIRVEVSAPDAPNDKEDLSVPVMVEPEEIAYIKLE